MRLLRCCGQTRVLLCKLYLLHLNLTSFSGLLHLGVSSPFIWVKYPGLGGYLIDSDPSMVPP